MTKILLAVLLVAVIGSGVATFAVVKIAAVNGSTNVVYDGSLQLRTLGEMRNAFNRPTDHPPVGPLRDGPEADPRR